MTCTRHSQNCSTEWCGGHERAHCFNTELSALPQLFMTGMSEPPELWELPQLFITALPELPDLLDLSVSEGL
jgi:hypothetical protein